MGGNKKKGEGRVGERMASIRLTTLSILSHSASTSMYSMMHVRQWITLVHLEQLITHTVAQSQTLPPVSVVNEILPIQPQILMMVLDSEIRI